MNEEKAKRSKELLLEASKALEDGRDPFVREWLVEHDVTLDECFNLSEVIALIIKGWLSSSKEDQHKIMILGAAKGVSGINIDILRNNLEMVQARRKLQAFSDGSK